MNALSNLTSNGADAPDRRPCHDGAAARGSFATLGVPSTVLWERTRWTEART